nr:hypothetical protein [Tanacetum cinerariifolium]
MDPNSSLGIICLGEDVVVISRYKVEGSGDWNSLKFQDTTNSGQNKAMVFCQMDAEEVSDRFVAPCFVNGLEDYDGEINHGVEENMISNEGEIYFVKFNINPEEDDVEPGAIFKRSFLRMAKAIIDFRARTITVYLDIDSFLEETEGEEKINDDLDRLLDFNIDDVPLLGEEGLLPFMCKIGKSKKRAIENLNFFYQDVRKSSSTEGHLTQEEAAKEAIAIKMSRKFDLLEEERPIIETIAYHDKYKKILDEVWKDKVELDGKNVKEEVDTVKRIKGEAFREKEDPGAFIFPIRLEGQVNKNALADTGSDIKTMPYNETFGRNDMKKLLVGYSCVQLVVVNTPKRLFLTFDGFCHQTFCAARSDIMRNAKSDSDDEEDYHIKRIKFGAPIDGPKPAPYLNCNDPDKAFNINEPIYAKICQTFYSTYEFDEVCADDELETQKIIKFRLCGRAHSLTLLEFARRLGLYQAVKLEEEGFNVYFEGVLRSDEHFNAQDYWLSISREENLGLSRSHTSTTRNPILRVIHKRITYGLCQRTTGYDKIHKNDLWLLRTGTQKESQICCGQFILKIAKKCKVLTEDMDVLNRMGYDKDIDDMLRIRLHEAGSDEEIFTLVAWIRAFNINEPIYAKICQTFYSTYEFDEIPVYDDDYDEDYTIAITHKEPDNSLSMGDEHLDTIPATESDKFIKSSVENLISNPSESEGEYECDVPACEVFTALSNILFDTHYDFSSSDNQLFSDEDILKEIYSNALFDEEFISMKIDSHHFNTESNLIEFLLSRDSSIISSSLKIDSLFDEFVGELTLFKSIPPGINETDCDPEEETCLDKRLLHDNSSPCPPKEFISENSDVAIESFSPSSIPIEDSDSFMEEINLSFTLNDPMPPGIEEDDYDSKRDILILEELLTNDILSLPKNESFHFDIPSSSRPPTKPPDGNSRILNVKVMGDITEHKVPMPRLMFTQPTLIPNQEKSPKLLPHLGYKSFQPSTKCLMMIYERNIPILDVLFLHFYPP